MCTKSAFTVLPDSSPCTDCCTQHIFKVLSADCMTCLASFDISRGFWGVNRHAEMLRLNPLWGMLLHLEAYCFRQSTKMLSTGPELCPNLVLKTHLQHSRAWCPCIRSRNHICVYRLSINKTTVSSNALQHTSMQSFGRGRVSLSS